MDEFGLYYVKWHENTNTVYYLYVKSKKYSTRVNVTKEAGPTDTESKLVVTVAKEERQYGSREWEVQWEVQDIGCMLW